MPVTFLTLPTACHQLGLGRTRCAGVVGSCTERNVQDRPLPSVSKIQSGGDKWRKAACRRIHDSITLTIYIVWDFPYSCYSIDNPRAYLESNIVGTFELLEAARAYPPAHVLLASTSSAFGANTQMPYREIDKADHQMSFYAAAKKAGENMAHSYAHLFDVPVTMFRFFTVYGPQGRPDMALFKFTKAILEGCPIDVYNHGDMRRDFTYVEDLVEAIRLLIDTPPVRPDPGEGVPEGDSLSPVAPWRVVNIGNSDAVQLTDFIAAIEDATGRKAVRNLMLMQAGDVPTTWADASLLKSLTGYARRARGRRQVRAMVSGILSGVRRNETEMAEPSISDHQLHMALGLEISGPCIILA
ncbi:NAD-dependent epimerase/dehydratase family protein [Sphingobium psychrophilum]|uniref:NAD-dependent epimerase/dehydratase family protein n=1 Tax=Sphingobium psychrophilum TaxID=2728834 RepID=UPI002E2ADEC6|nr:NAD-dependent epimerase/dehydratase family protein [Sphingobium psychrophilum]